MHRSARTEIMGTPPESVWGTSGPAAWTGDVASEVVELHTEVASLRNERLQWEEERREMLQLLKQAITQPNPQQQRQGGNFSSEVCVPRLFLP